MAAVVGVVRGRGRARGLGRKRGRGGGRGRGRNPPRDVLPDIQWEEFQRVERNPGENVAFNEILGPSRAAMMAESVSDHFKLFIPDTLVQSWVTETKRYKRQSRLAKPTNMKWTEVTFEEILAYLGKVIAMGLVNQSKSGLCGCEGGDGEWFTSPAGCSLF